MDMSDSPASVDALYKKKTANGNKISVESHIPNSEGIVPTLVMRSPVEDIDQ